MNKFSVVLVFSFLLYSCNERNAEEPIIKTQSLVKFYLDDSVMNLNNNFTLVFFKNGDKIYSHISKDSIYWQTNRINKNDVFKAEFTMDGFKITIDSLPGYLLMNEMKADVIFGIDSLSSNNLKDHGLAEDVSAYKNSKKICFVKFDPTENAIGRVFTKVTE